MREIKFRMWDEEEQQMISGDGLAFEEYAPISDLLTQEGIMQYTGLKDKNGNEIYESDEVLIFGSQELDWSNSFDWNEKAIVRWSEVECGFYLDVINKREVNICEDGYFTVDTFPLRQWQEEEWGIEYEVTGNVWEHPHLLEGREEA